MTDELLPCPFCGSKADWDWWHEDTEQGNTLFVYECYCTRQECHARGPQHPTKEQAIAAWNDRAIMPEPVDETEDIAVGQKFQVVCYRDPEQPEHFFDIEYFIDHLRDQDDYLGDYTDHWFDALREKSGLLEQAVRRVIAEYLDGHSLRPSFGLAAEIEELTYRGPVQEQA